MTVLTKILLGRVRPFGPEGRPSGIDKQPVTGTVDVTPTGLQCGDTRDAQGNLKHHGGPEKAVHHYAFEHYAFWRQTLPGFAFDAPGAFGENFATEGMDEKNVHIGDIYRVGSAVLQVSQARQPCATLNHRFHQPRMARLVQESGLTGWYYRVLEPGTICAGDRLTLLERPHAAWPLARLLRVLYVETLDKAQLEAMAGLSALSSGWRDLAIKRLASGQVEDWRARLTGAK